MELNKRLHFHSIKIFLRKMLTVGEEDVNPSYKRPKLKNNSIC